MRDMDPEGRHASQCAAALGLGCTCAQARGQSCTCPPYYADPSERALERFCPIHGDAEPQPPAQPKGPGPCPKCGADTVHRTNSFTLQQFYGCGRFPKCTGSRQGPWTDKQASPWPARASPG